MGKGKLYGVSVGPGEPELLTLKAVRIIEKCPVVASPVTRKGETVALNIARGAVDLSGKEIVELSFPMSRDRAALMENYARVAALLAEYLDKGQDVAMLNLGDISVYSTYSYVDEEVRRLGYETEWVPGVTSFCAVAAKLRRDLSQWDEMLHVIPSSVEDLDGALRLPGNKIVMKPGRELGKVVAALERNGLLDRAGMVQNCGLPNERIVPVLRADEASTDYFTTILVK